MKRFISILILAICFAGTIHAQKSGYVDTEFILGQMEEYTSAQEEVNMLSQKWQRELEKMYTEIEKMYKDYQAEEVLLPEDVRKQRQEDIFEMERKAKDYKQAKFGFDGELYKVQDDKIKLIQDKVFNAVEQVAKDRRLDFIWDKSAKNGLLYTNSAFDRTDDVMVKLGLKR
ncbi:MAG TPA: OmpH family outer membrane protein [Bacteroidetes bacterium]|nr:OmpH family outer membrane protein [Bacteroidota bacterium]